VKLIIQPDDGLAPLLKAVRSAKKTIDIVIFRFDRIELEKALEAAVARGVVVRALIAHTNRGGEKSLRKLELRMLDAGVTVARTADDLPRYHGKMMVVDDELHVFGFNYTKLDIEKSRSFGISTRDKRLVKEAASLFEADSTRQPYNPSHDHLVVSPESSREILTAFIKKAKKQLLIYDAKVSDRLILRLLAERAKNGVEIRMFGKLGKGATGIEARKLPDLRLHVRSIIRDGSAAFMGSQSLRKLELDGRREVGIIVTDSRIAKKMQAVFEADWAHTPEAKAADKAEEKAAEKGEKKEEAAKNGAKEAVTSGV
jgi:phosphatidylserine/phosphatidylglycerophosphate/cardiolipin synthase-like enzyme